jgi:molybdopterin-guanine dinucleotide biosynthesis protein B
MVKIGIVGAKNSGKTTLIERLVPHLKSAGLRVATVKHTAHKHSFDKEGKDSWRHRQAGAGLTLAVCDGEMALFGPSRETFLQMTDDIMSSHFDICLIEGDKFSVHPKVLLTFKLEDSDCKLSEHVIATYGRKTCTLDIPHFAMNQVEALASLLAKKAQLPETGEVSSRG